MHQPLEKPLLIGWRAAKANLIPGLIIQALMLAVVLAYYWHEPTRNWLDSLAQWKSRLGYLFSIPLAMVAGALLPEVLQVLVFHRRRLSIGNLLFVLIFWGFMGACVDTLYRLQEVWLGSTPSVSVLVKKVLVDQFVYNPLWAAPISVIAYEWRNRGFATAFLPYCFTLEYYRRKVLPTLIATWGLWIPLVAIIYSLPPLLQIPLFGLALSFWVLILTYITQPAASPLCLTR